MKITIIGAGISGLSLAWELQKEHEVTLLEASDRVGGWIQTHRINDAVFEYGPRSMRLATVPPIIPELGLELIEAATTTKFLAESGALQKLPDSMWGMLFSPLGRKGIKGLLRYPFARSQIEDESVQSYFEKRCGADFVDTFIDPLMAGIWATDPSELSYHACFSKRKKGAKVVSIKGGLQTLPDAIASRLQADIRLNTRVEKLEGTCVKTTRGSVEADRVICTVGDIVPGYSVPQTSLVTVSLGFQGKLLHQSGFGFLTSSKEETELLGVVFDSEVFPSMNGAFQTRLSVMLGGGRAPGCVEGSEEELMAKAAHYIDKYLGIKVAPDFAAVRRCVRAIPAFKVGYLAEREQLVAQLEPQGIALHGAAFYNPSIAACLERVSARL